MRRRHLGVLLLIVAIAVTGYVVARQRRDFWDFEVYRTAGIRAVHAEQLYRAADGHYQFKYWPIFAFVVAPFGYLPNEFSKMVWYALSIACLAYLFRQALHLLPDRRHSAGMLVGWTLLFMTKFIVRELVNGQTNLLMAVLALGALAAGQRGKAWLAGLLVGLAVIAKPYALILAPWIAVTLGAEALVSTGVAIAVALLLPAAVYGWAGNLQLLRDWYATVTSTTAPNLMLPENISFGSMWGKWLGLGPVADRVTLVSIALAMATGAWVWWRRDSVRSPGYLELGVLLMLVPLISPQGWDYVLIISLPAYMCLVDRLGSLSRAWQALAIGGVLLTSFTVFDLLGRRFYAWTMTVAVVSVGAVMLLACLAHLRARKLA